MLIFLILCNFLIKKGLLKSDSQQLLRSLFSPLKRIIAMSLQHLANTTQVGISDS